MAVSNGVAPNLSGSYENIQRALQEGANLALNKPGIASTVNAAIAPFAQDEIDRRQKLYEATLDDQLNKNKIAYGAQAAGKSLVTPNMLGAHAAKFGLDADSVSDMVPSDGVYMSPEDQTNVLSKLRVSQVVENDATAADDGTPQGKRTANMIRIAGYNPDSSGAIETLRAANRLSQLKTRTGLNGNLEAYDPMNPTMAIPIDNGIATANGKVDIDDPQKLKAFNKDQYTNLLKATDEASKDPELKAYANSLDELKNTKALLDKNLPGTQINIGASTAKAIANIPGGKFTSLLAMTEGKDPALMARLGQGYQTATVGNLSDTNKNIISQELGIAETSKTSELAAALNDKHQHIKALVAPNASDDLIARSLPYQRYLQSSTVHSTIPTITSQAQYDALPAGSQYIDSTGKTKTKGTP